MRPLLLLALLGACKSNGSIVLDDSGGVDADGDGYGLSLDCNDEDASIHPDADELCDGLDNDCDGLLDNDAVDGVLVYPDEDGDGYGAPNALRVCGAVSGGVQNGDDCDDTDAAVNPGASEVCDDADRDEDCSGAADDADPGVSRDSLVAWYPDADGDGYGATGPARDACEAEAGEVADNTDCDDGDPGANPALGCPSRWDGTYSGDVSVAVRITQWGTSDTCTGEGTMEVNGRGDPQVSGSVTCSFQGYLRWVVGSQTVSFTGAFTAEDDVSGTISVGSYFSDDWSGSFSGRGRFSGTFEGSANVEGYDVTYAGTLDFSG